MTTLIINLLYLIATFFYGTIFTLLFLDIPFNKKTVVRLSVFSFFSIIAQAIIGLVFSFEIVEMLYPLLVHVPLFIMCTFVYHRYAFTSLSSIFMCYFLTSPRYLLDRLITYPFADMPYRDIIGKTIATIPMSVLIFFFALAPIRKGFKRSKKDILLFFIPLMAIYLISYILSVYTNLLQLNPSLFLEIIYTTFFCFILFYLKMYFSTFDEKIELENRQHLLEVSSISMKKQLRNIQESNEQTRIMRHDLRHLCTMIEQFANDGDIEQIHNCIQGIHKNIDHVIIKQYCQHPIINTILSSYLTPFINNNMSITVKTNVPESIFVDDTDLCIILANMLENAYHACINLDNPQIALEINTSSDLMWIQMKNSCSNAITFEAGLPVSTRSEHGYGSKSIALLVEKYHGLYSFSSTDGVFMTKLILHNN